MIESACQTIYYVCCWLIITLVCILVLMEIRKSQELFLERKTCSSGAVYGIQEMFNNTQEAVELLGQIHRDMINFTSKLVKKYCNGVDKKNKDNNIYYPNVERSGLTFENICEGVKRLDKRVNTVQVEEAPNEDNSSSYTIDKDKLLAVCLRKKPENEIFHDYNTLWFVIAHEMAHMMSVSEGHNDEFIRHFKFILYESVEQGLYRSVNYKTNPMTYCGVKVTNNPIY
jgi:hypothetical protein